MIEWLSLQALRLFANLNILWTNPTGCSAVGFLRLAALTLLALLAIKLIRHALSVRWLKTSFPLFAGPGSERLMKVYRQIAAQVGLSSPPPIHRFADRRPLVFAVGVWRPALFLNPGLVSQLQEPELKALLAHELTHVRRRDALRTWLLEVCYALLPALVVLFFGLRFVFSQPHSTIAVLSALAGLLLARLTWRPIQALREQTCDDLTVELVRDPLALAAALVKTWRMCRRLPQPRWGDQTVVAESFVHSRFGLEARIRRLLDYRPPRWKFFLARIGRIAWVATLSVTLLFLIQFHLQGERARLEKGSICMAAFLGE